MKKLFFILSIFLTIYSCNNSKKTNTTLYHLIPENASLVLKINDLETFKSDIKNNDFISKLNISTLQKNIAIQFENLKTNNPILICFEKNNNTYDFSIITKFHDSLLTGNNNDSLNIYSKIIDSIYISSASKSTIDQIKRFKNSTFENLSETTNNNSSFSIFINNKNCNNIGNTIIPEDINNFSNGMTLDAEISPDQINFNGITLANDTLPQVLKIFKNTIPQENTIQQIVPSNSNGFLSFTYNDFDLLKNNINNFYNKPVDSTFNSELFHTINEGGEIYFDTDTAIILKSIDATATIEALQNHQNVVSNFRNVAVFEFNNPNIFKTVFSPFISTENISNYIIIDDFFVFAKSIEQLQNIITNFQNGTTLINTNSYKESMFYLSDESSLLVIASPTKLKQIISSISSYDYSNLKLTDYKTSAIQFVQDDGFVHINAVIKKNKSRAHQNSISEEFNVTVDADIIMQPQFVTNHRTKQKDIVVQDVNNNLYLISNTGKVLWKKKLNGEVLGRIQQVDLYKNRRLQLAFATSKRIYIIDRNGNNVSPFPLKFNSEITQPLSIFDYDNTKNYRFLVTQGKFLLMYDRNAKNVSGFRYNNTGNNITTQPKHFRIGNKDYIVFATDKKMMILNRKGQSRIKVKENINFSGNPIFKYNNKFTTTSLAGELVQVNTKGNVSKLSLNLGEGHFVVTTDKTLVTLSDNNLAIKLKTYELDFGNYTTPKIFYLNDKIYISLTDLQTQKVYLFDSQAKLLNNFPVYGNSTLDIANIDNDNRLEFVVKGESNSIIVYKKN